MIELDVLNGEDSDYEEDFDPTKCRLCGRDLRKDESDECDGRCYGCTFGDEDRYE